MPLESLELTEQDYISYYAYAIDNREWGQQRSESDVRYIDIRPLRQFYGEIELEPGMGGNNRVIVQLDEIIRRQRFLINRTRKFVRGGITNMAKELGTIDRMVESQSELAGLTRFLAEFFVMQGNDDVEALNQAEAAMLQASDSLAAGNFELALAQEQEALRALAEARRSLEIFLIKNPQLRRQQAFRQFARQLRQKLRRDPPETEREIADTLQRLAAQQMQLSQTAQNLAAQTQQQGSGGSGRGNGGKPSDQNQNSPSANSQNANNSDQDSENQPQNDQQSENNADPAEGNQGDPQQNPGGQGENEPSDDQTGNQDENAGNNPSENESENAGTGDNLDDPSNEKRGGDQDSEENPSGDGQGDPEDERSLQDQLTDLYGKQVDLLERLQDLEDQLSESRTQSPLLAERIDEAKETMDDLATQAREGQLGSFQTREPRRRRLATRSRTSTSNPRRPGTDFKSFVDSGYDSSFGKHGKPIGQPNECHGRYAAVRTKSGQRESSGCRWSSSNGSEDNATRPDHPRHFEQPCGNHGRRNERSKLQP